MQSLLAYFMLLCVASHLKPVMFISNQWRTQGFFFGWGVQQNQLRTEERENGDLGAVAP